MNILYVSNEYPPETGYGGIGTYTKYCAEGMVDRGHRVHVICRSPSGALSTARINGVFVHRASEGTYPLPGYRLLYLLRAWCYRNIPHSLERLAWAREAYLTYTNHIRTSVKFDIIEYPECGGEGVYFGKVNDTRRIVRLHTPWEMVREFDYIDESKPDRALTSFVERTAARRSSAASSPSKAMACEIEKRWRIHGTEVVPNPIPVSTFKMSKGTDWIYTGRIEFRKGVHTLIKAYANVLQAHNLPHLYLIGRAFGKHRDGSVYGEYIEKLIYQSGVSDHVSWIKGVDNSSIPGYLQQCAVAIFPSVWENFPYSCLEAMASGLTVVATKSGGFPEIIEPGKTGMLFESENEEELSLCLAHLCANPQDQKKLGENARTETLRNFDTVVVCKKMETLYQSVAQGTKP